MLLRIFYECDKKKLSELSEEVELNLRYLSSYFAIYDWCSSFDFKVSKHLEINKKNEITDFTLLSFLDLHKPDYEDGIQVTESSEPEISSSVFFRSENSSGIDFSISFDLGGSKNNVGLILIEPIEKIPSFSSINDVIGFIEFITSHLFVNRIEVYDFNFTSKILQTASNEIELGWVVFLSNKYKMPILSSDFQQLDIGNGKLIIVTEEPFDTNNPIHCKRVKSLRDAFLDQKIFIIREGVKPIQKSGYELFLENLKNGPPRLA